MKDLQTKTHNQHAQLPETRKSGQLKEGALYLGRLVFDKGKWSRNATKLGTQGFYAISNLGFEALKDLTVKFRAINFQGFNYYVAA